MTEISEDNILYHNNGLYGQNSSVHGRGVFAAKMFNIDDILEVFPLTPMAFRTRYQGDIGVLTYSFINTKIGRAHV